MENEILVRVRELCNKRGWTTYRLALESGIGQTTLSNLFKRNNIPTIPTLERICAGFGISLSQFFADDRDANSPKLYSYRQIIKKDIPDTELCNFLMTSQLLSDELSKKVISDYSKKVIKSGNYYSLKEAIKLIENNKTLYAATKAKLINVLMLIDSKELYTIHKAREHFVSPGESLAEKEMLRYDFNRTLRKLADLGINPVTIPERWRIPFIPGLVSVYDL